MRVLSMGVYPIQKLNSQVVGQDDVSNERMRTLMTMPTKKNVIPTSTTTPKKNINTHTTSVYLNLIPPSTQYKFPHRNFSRLL